MTYDDWFDTYERDGGELMLYNTIDMRSAFQAGAVAANGVLREALEEIEYLTRSHVGPHTRAAMIHGVCCKALQQAGGGE